MGYRVTFAEFLIPEPSIRTVSTVLSLRPPEQTPPVKVISCSKPAGKRKGSPKPLSQRVPHRPGINSNAVILIVHVRTGNGNASTTANIECIRIRSAVGIVVGVVNHYLGQGQIGRAVDAENLDWRALDVDASDGGRLHAMGVEERGLGLAAVGALAVPPAAAVTVIEVPEMETMGSAHLHGD